MNNETFKQMNVELADIYLLIAQGSNAFIPERKSAKWSRRRIRRRKAVANTEYRIEVMRKINDLFRRFKAYLLVSGLYFTAKHFEYLSQTNKPLAGMCALKSLKFFREAAIFNGLGPGKTSFQFLIAMQYLARNRRVICKLFMDQYINPDDLMDILNGKRGNNAS